ncbi:MAG: hypothetical protein ABI601_13710 [bacterium]
MHRIRFALVALLCLGAVGLGAQSASLGDVRTGARVRIETSGSVAGRYEGTVLNWIGDSLTIGGPDQAPIVLTVARVTSFQVSRGNSRVAGAVRGLEWGVPIGLAFGALAISTTSQCHDVCAVGNNWKVARLFALSGLLWGAGFGALIGRERWGPRQLVPRTALEAGLGGAALTLRVEF